MGAKMLKFGIASDLAVIGHNPEAADMDHPNGEIIGERFYMIAEDADGYRWSWGWADSKERLELEFEFLAPPVSEWNESRPCYGSKAWEATDQDGQDAFAERRAFDVPKGLEPGPFARIYW